MLKFTIQVHIQHFPLLLRSVASPYLHESIQTNIVQLKSMWIIFRCLFKSLFLMTAGGRERVQSVAWSGTAIPYNPSKIHWKEEQRNNLKSNLISTSVIPSVSSLGAPWWWLMVLLPVQSKFVHYEDSRLHCRCCCRCPGSGQNVLSI